MGLLCTLSITPRLRKTLTDGWCLGGKHCQDTELASNQTLYLEYFQSFTSLSDSTLKQGTETVISALFKAARLLSQKQSFYRPEHGSCCATAASSSQFVCVIVCLSLVLSKRKSVLAASEGQHYCSIATASVCVRRAASPGELRFYCECDLFIFFMNKNHLN